jgi:hypothetical protein
MQNEVEYKIVLENGWFLCAARYDWRTPEDALAYFLQQFYRGELQSKPTHAEVIEVAL